MSQKIDLSQLDSDESLLLWEKLFPEYATGAEKFPSGKDTVTPPAQTQQQNEPSTVLEDKAYSSNFTNESVEPADFVTDNPEMDWLNNAIALEEKNEKNQDYWANKFNQLNFPGMDLMAVSYIGITAPDLLEQHLMLRRVVRDYTRLLAYNYVNDLRSAGVSEEGIFYMRKGKIPENYTVHLKYPIEYGGSIDFNNMVFMQDKPYHAMIHSYIDEQLLTVRGISYPALLYIPVPVGKIYIPFGMFTGSGGKNKQDRSVYAGFSKAAFEKIALKAMPGR